MDEMYADRRRQQAQLYGDPIDVLADKVHQLMGLGIGDLAEVIGLSVPMLTKLVAAERVGIGNAIAMGRLTQLQDFTRQLISGEASRDEIELTLAQIKASTTPARPSRVTAVANAGPVTPPPNTSPRPATVAPGTGEHPVLTAQSLAYAGGRYGLPVTIVVPKGNNPDQTDSIDGLGAEVIEHGEDFQQAREFAARLAGERGLLMVPPFHAWLVEGIATYAAELHESVPGLEVIYVPIGMGSGICANIMVRDLLGLRTEIVGVVTAGAPAYALSFDAGRPVTTDHATTFVDGAACRTPDPVAVDIICRGASRIVQVSEEEAAEAMALTYRTTHNLAEPAGSLALAGMLADTKRTEGKRSALIQSGGNCDFETLARVTADVG